jgi:hypothetical protein
MEDIIEREPHEAFPPVSEDGVVVFKGTGDKVIDEWETAIAKGKTPDVVDAFRNNPEVMKWLRGKSKPQPQLQPEELPEEFHDDFTNGDPDGPG